MARELEQTMARPMPVAPLVTIARRAAVLLLMPRVFLVSKMTTSHMSIGSDARTDGLIVTRRSGVVDAMARRPPWSGNRDSLVHGCETATDRGGDLVGLPDEVGELLGPEGLCAV